MAKISLTKLTHGIDCKIYGDASITVSGITDNSKEVKPGYVFVAVKGLTHDGHKFINQAIKSGARSVIGESSFKNDWSGTTYVKVNNSRKVLGEVASNWFDNPSKKLKVIGVTGTDGKTTTASIIYHILNSAGKKTGLVSTVSAKIGNKEYDTGFHVTNPDPIALHGFLSKMVAEGCKYAVLEVTSHGIDQQRISGIKFDTAVLTNITNEHLDYHRDFKTYQDTKAKLFKIAHRFAVLNKDDSSFDKIFTIVNKKSKLISYSLNDKSADYLASEISQSGDELKFNLNANGKSLRVSVGLVGKFNVSNILAATAACVQYGINLVEIVDSISSYKLPRGRLQEVINERGLKIFIDYAHTPNAVENILKAFESIKTGRLICIVSAEGERDPGKRLEIPKTAAKYADLTILNPIDPRSENPEKILKEMEKGAISGGGKFKSFIDRKEAIDYAIKIAAKKGDTVLILGKGHEIGMDYGDHEEMWSDEKEVKRALK